MAAQASYREFTVKYFNKLLLHRVLLTAPLLAAIWGFPVAAETIVGPAAPVPATYFGMHFHRLDAGTAWPREAGIGSWRLWDARVIWSDIEPQRGQRDFTKLDRYVAMAGLLKIDLTMALGMTPTWASARPQEKAPYRPGGAAEPREINDWSAFVGAVAARYAGRIQTYDIWNEVNAGTGFFSGTPQAMLELQRVAYTRIKQIDPAAVVVSPSVVGSAPHQLKWFDDYLGLGAGQYADVIGYHFYQPRERPEALPGLVRKVREIMGRRGLAAKPLWNTESGYRMDLGQGDRAMAADSTWPKLDEPTAAAYVSRGLIIGWLSGLSRSYWYAWDNAELGFLRQDGSATPAAAAYGRTARWLTGAVLEHCTVTAGFWQCQLKRENAKAWLLWRESGSVTASSDALKGAGCIVTADGAKALISQAAAVVVGPLPIMVTDCDQIWR